MRILVDRLWPRGMSKATAKVDLWVKDVSPSTALRSWFHKDKEKRFRDFSKKYKKELLAGKELAHLKKALQKKKVVTLITSVKDLESSHIPILLKLLK